MVKIIVFCITFICMTYGTILRIKNGKVSGLFFLLTFWLMSRALFEVSRAFSRIPQKCHGHFFLSRAKICDFCHGQTKNCHGHFLRSNCHVHFFVSRAYFGQFWKKCHGQLKTCHVEKKTLPSEPISATA